MGTNYYIELNFCDKCERFDRIHIGKSSGGWKFTIEIHELYYKTFEEFVEFIRNKDVRDEYGEQISFDELMDKIESKKKDKSHFEGYPNEKYADCEEVDLHKGEFS